jgi:hypothetical protein
MQQLPKLQARVVDFMSISSPVPRVFVGCDSAPWTMFAETADA